MAAEDNVFPRKLKFKITSKGIREDSKDESHVNYGQRDRVSGGGSKRSEGNVLVKPSVPVNSGKRRPEMSLDGQRGKKPKMDHNLKLQFGNILKELINHPAGWIFSEPVDPVKLKIPDYFSIIAEPMDLGTIKRKLEGNMYFGADEFAADVRLTFSNAMLYNPPGHEVYNWAKKLDANFSRRWKLLEAKFKHGNKNDEGVSAENNHQDLKPIALNKSPLLVKLRTSRPMSFKEKCKFRVELVQVLRKTMVGKLQTVFQKFGLIGLNEERLDSFIDSTDDETLWKLRSEIKVILDARDGKVKPGKMALNGCSSLNKVIEKEHCSRNASASSERRQSVDSTTEAKACASLTCHGLLKVGAAQGSASDISSERSSEDNHYGDSKLDCEVKYPSITTSSGVDSDGPGVVVNEECSPRLSTPASVEGWTFNVQMSPQKALRAAMLKSRFADTIFKATHQSLLDHGEKPHPLRLQRERERLEREQLEEKARIEAQIKAAEAASQRRQQDDLKMQREREREAARMALQKIEKTVEIDENIGILKDLEMICRGNLFDMRCKNPLERLGLYIKDDYMEEEENAVMNGEEGEILL